MITRWILKVCLAFTMAAPAWCGELDAREALLKEAAHYLRNDDFDGLQARYSKALATRERLPSGLFASSWLLQAYAEAAGTQSSSLVAGTGAEFDLRKHLYDRWKVPEDRATRWVTARPGSSLAAVLLSEVYLQQGLIYRGHGPLSGVPKKDLAIFDAKVQQALDVLNSRAAEGSKDPGWYWQMLRVARYQRWEPQRFTELLRRALAVGSGHYDIYFAASEALLPQAGGSMETVERFAEFAVNHTKESEGQSLYARIYWNLLPYVGAAIFDNTRADWKRMKVGFEDLVKRYPDVWNLNGYAWFACAAGDQVAAKAMFATIADRAEPEIWGTRQAWTRCKRWAERPEGGKQ